MILWKQNKNHVLGLKPRQKIGWGKCWGENNSMLFSSLLGCSVLLLCQSAWPKNSPMVHLLMDGLLQPWGCIGDKLALSQWSQRPAPCSSKPLFFCHSLPAHLGKRQEWRLCPSALAFIYTHGMFISSKDQQLSRSWITFWVIVSSLFSISEVHNFSPMILW